MLAPKNGEGCRGGENFRLTRGGGGGLKEKYRVYIWERPQWGSERDTNELSSKTLLQTKTLEWWWPACDVSWIFILRERSLCCTTPAPASASPILLKPNVNFAQRFFSFSSRTADHTMARRSFPSCVYTHTDGPFFFIRCWGRRKKKEVKPPKCEESKLVSQRRRVWIIGGRDEERMAIVYYTLLL